MLLIDRFKGKRFYILSLELRTTGTPFLMLNSVPRHYLATTKFELKIGLLSGCFTDSFMVK